MNLPTPIDEITEKQLDQQVRELLLLCGWDTVYHTYRSTRSPAGYPDIVALRERQVVLELKRESGRLSDAQKHWITRFLEVGVETYLVRPRHLDMLAQILASRAERPAPARATLDYETRVEVGLALRKAA